MGGAASGRQAAMEAGGHCYYRGRAGAMHPYNNDNHPPTPSLRRRPPLYHDGPPTGLGVVVVVVLGGNWVMVMP